MTYRKGDNRAVADIGRRSAKQGGGKNFLLLSYSVLIWGQWLVTDGGGAEGVGYYLVVF